ncbi:uncharacterized protein PV09_08219 [Verruconis gallopava]|uniref:Uncharacterized protein n=1 Tax=Verruconis gallopava TaxID=253628 RepID=A0A0D2A0K5_9PEZI|nr:uncharacterized protein PV09_08219 [Verruconis gallopava]KIW00178.1 hypothetical protein PV09_08219 [Verruconis gallopava]
MTGFLDLPRELRDFVYAFAARDDDPVLIFSNMYPRKLVTSHDSTALLLTSKQIHAEYSEMLIKNGLVVIAYGKDRRFDILNSIPPTVARRTRTLIAIVELDGMRAEGWKLDSVEEAISPVLKDVLTDVESLGQVFPNLHGIEMQWWNDLSIAGDRERSGEWINALLSVNLVKSSELWRGYLGGCADLDSMGGTHFTQPSINPRLHFYSQRCSNTPEDETPAPHFILVLNGTL